MKKEQQLPNAREVECALLASILHKPEIIHDYTTIPSEAFYWFPTRVVFEEIIEMSNSNIPIDTVTLTIRLIDTKKLDKIGGASILAEITEAASGSPSYYAAILREKYARRTLILKAREIETTMATDETMTAEQCISQTESTLMDLRTSRSSSKMTHIEAAISEAIDQIDASVRLKGKLSGLPTGIQKLDNATSGILPEQLVIVAARPSVGKTTMLLQWARSFAEVAPIAFFSLEMSQSQLATKLISRESKINVNRIKRGVYMKHEVQKMYAAANLVSGLPIFIDDTGGITVSDLRSRARRAVTNHGVKAIFVDYLQLLKSPSKRASASRVTEIADVSVALKEIAKELKIPVVAAAQLNRSVEQRTNGKPKLSDLRESGQIEQDADIVCLLHRLPPSEEEDGSEKEVAEMSLAKHRLGPLEEMLFVFKKEYSSFEEIEEMPKN